jgi:putative two-component system response regulator
MEMIHLISTKPEKWERFKKSLSISYEFANSKPGEDVDFSEVAIIAVDEIESINKIPSAEKKSLPIVFFGNFGDFSTEIKVRKLGVADFFSIPFDKELLLLRFKSISRIFDLIKFRSDNLHWMHSVKREMINLQEGMAEVIAQTVESRDEYTGGHITRTATFIGLLGEEFIEKGVLTRDQLNLIIRAAPLHDIGKIGIRDSILLKPGQLTDSERLEMMKHTEKGAILIKKIQKRFSSHIYLQYAYDIALNHHERFDGKGYPNGKKGEEIPFSARLMSVVDVYDALVSDRVYRKGIPKEKAFEIIFSGNNTQFDPTVLKAFGDCKDYLV